MNVAVNEKFDALAGARHSDPFSVLGPHRDGDGVVIRTYQPSAERVEVTHARGATIMKRHPAGVFEASFPGTEIFDYRLRIT